MKEEKFELLRKKSIELNDRARRQMNGETERFVSAYYRSPLEYYDALAEAHAAGFDNYPAAHVNPDPIFFMEKLMGCRMRFADGIQDFFHTFCVPLIEKPGDIDKVKIDLPNHPLWNAMTESLAWHTQSEAGALPVFLPSFAPLDTACAVMGVCDFLELLADDPAGAEHILAFITNLYIEMIVSIHSLKVRTVNAVGYPGTYVSDLNTVNLSPKTLERIIPFYERAAEHAGGMTVNIAVPDIGLMGDIVSVPAFHSFFFDARLNPVDIAKILGKKLFIIYSYIYDDGLDGVTLKNGEYVNPIVSAHSRNAAEIIGALEGHSVLTALFRFTKREAVQDAETLRRLGK